MTFSNLIDVLDASVEKNPDKIAFTYLSGKDFKEQNLSYVDLHKFATSFGACLEGLYQPRDRVILAYPTNLEFIKSFFACIYAGLIPVPIPLSKTEYFENRLKLTIEDCSPSAILTTQSYSEFINSLSGITERVKTIASDTTDDYNGNPTHWKYPPIKEQDTAFIQYTSGSISIPKGVENTHENLIYNLRMIEACYEMSKDMVMFSWVPFFHDLGLVGSMMSTVFVGGKLVFISPRSFVRQPSLWLEGISRYSATISGGPNFAYELCTRKIIPGQKTGLDLASWEIAYSAGEPVHASTMERFYQQFKDIGFRNNMHFPSYGMAETGVFISGGPKNRLPNVLRIDRKSLEQNIIKPVASIKKSIEIVSCGKSYLNQKIKIVDPKQFVELDEAEIGEVWVSGNHVAKGYWNKEQETKNVFYARTATNERAYLRTGDLGFIYKDELYITGRLKDMMIVGGRNIYPQDLELAITNDFKFLEPNSCAVFCVTQNLDEKIIALLELERSVYQSIRSDKRQANHERYCLQQNQLIKETINKIEKVAASVLVAFEADLHRIVMLRPGSIPKTTSGKIQRSKCKQLYLDQTFQPVLTWPTEIENREIHDLEDEILKIVDSVLPFANIDPNASLISLGIDSKSAMQILLGIKRKFYINLSLKDFFELKTLDELVKIVKLLTQTKKN